MESSNFLDTLFIDLFIKNSFFAFFFFSFPLLFFRENQSEIKTYN